MDFNAPRTRINASMIAGHRGKGVCVLGLATTVDPSGSAFQMTTSDKQTIKIQMQEPLQEYVAGLVEVQGLVQPDNSIQCHNYVLFAPESAQNFDMDMYDKAVQLMNQYPEHYLQGNIPAA